MSNTRSVPTEKLDTFKNRLNGSVVTEGDKSYDQLRMPWLRVIDQHPALIVNAATIEDIAETVRFARENDLELAVQNTGHGIAVACDGGVLLRLSEMKGIVIDESARTATVEPGVQGGELLAAAEPHGLAFPTGQASNVGVTGYTLGGGVGWLSRKTGPACHAMRSATVVLADGSIVTASSTEHPELFWALRGGGGNFGVVASLTLQLVEGAKIFGGMVYYRMKDAPEVLRFYREWTAGLSNDTTTVLRLMKVPPKAEFLLHLLTETCAIGLCHTNEQTADGLHKQLKNFKSPVLDQLEFRPYSTMAEYDEASHLSNAQSFGHQECFQELGDGVIDGLLAIVKTRMPPIMQIEVQQWGGASTEARSDKAAAAFNPPQSPFLLHIVSPVMKTTLGELASVTEQAVDSLGDVYTGEVLYNFLRGDQASRVPDAFGSEKFARLQAVKQRYDPPNFFHLNLNVSPAAG